MLDPWISQLSFSLFSRFVPLPTFPNGPKEPVNGEGIPFEYKPHARTAFPDHSVHLADLGPNSLSQHACGLSTSSEVDSSNVRRTFLPGMFGQVRSHHSATTIGALGLTPISWESALTRIFSQGHFHEGLDLPRPLARQGKKGDPVCEIGVRVDDERQGGVFEASSSCLKAQAARRLSFSPRSVSPALLLS